MGISLFSLFTLLSSFYCVLICHFIAPFWFWLCICALFFQKFYHFCFLILGLFQYGEWHLAQYLGFNVLGIQVCPHLLHVYVGSGGISSMAIISKSFGSFISFSILFYLYYYNNMMFYKCYYVNRMDCVYCFLVYRVLGFLSRVFSFLCFLRLFSVFFRCRSLIVYFMLFNTKAFLIYWSLEEEKLSLRL